jgi:hypothetical protein
VSTSTLSGAMRHLLQNPAELASLAVAARARHLKTWPEYSKEFVSWMSTLIRRTL